MVDFTFDSMFRTTNKGLPDTANISPYTYLSMNHFVYSLIVQIIIGLVLTGYTGMAVYRAFYKIKNQKFFPADVAKSQEEAEKEQTVSKKSQKDDQKQSNTAENLIYRFDEEESEKQKNEEEGKEEQQEAEEEENEVEEETVNEETTEWFLSLDHKMLFFQPFLIGFVVAVNIFASNVLVVLLLGLALVCYFLFNIKQYCNKSSVFQLFFIVPCIATFLTVFFEDKDMST